MLETDGSVFDEDSFRLTRRFGGGGRLSANPVSGSSNTNNTNSNSNSGNNAGSSNSDSNVDRGDSRKSAYRIRDHRWYDSYRDEIFSNTSSSHHHNHHHHCIIIVVVIAVTQILTLDGS